MTWNKALLCIPLMWVGCAHQPPVAVPPPQNPKVVALPEGGHLVELDSRTEWGSTDMALRTGQKVAFRATGTWGESPGVSRSPDGGPAGMFGSGYWGLVPAVTEAPWGSLVGRVGNQRFFIGRERVVEIMEPGTLMLSINDATGNFADNHGAVTVRVSPLP